MFGYDAAEASFNAQENPAYLYEEEELHPLVEWAEDHEVELEAAQEERDEFDALLMEVA